MFDTLSQLAAEWILPALFFWLVLCIFAINVEEWLLIRLNIRKRYLVSALSAMLGDRLLVQKLYESPLIKTRTYSSESNQLTTSIKYPSFPKSSLDPRPDYLNSRLFSQIILNWLVEAYTSQAQKRKNSGSIRLHANVRKMRDTYPYLAEILEILLSGFSEKKYGRSANGFWSSS